MTKPITSGCEVGIFGVVMTHVGFCSVQIITRELREILVRENRNPLKLFMNALVI